MGLTNLYSWWSFTPLREVSMKLVILSLTLLISCVSGATPQPAQPQYEVIKENPKFPGYLYRPNVQGRTFPAILFLHGSEGGHGNYWQPPNMPSLPVGEDNFTARLAKHYAGLGYVTYALCYFDCRHPQGFANYPPDELIGVDIKNYVHASMVWLKQSQWVNGKKVAVWGGSRGAELTLLLSSELAKANSRFPEKLELPDAILAESPSDFIAHPYSKENADRLSKSEPPLPVPDNQTAWTFGQIPLPTGQDIPTELYTGPSLITFWETDPIWGPLVDINRILNRYQQSRIPYQLLQHVDPNMAAHDYQKFLLYLKENPRLFVEFKGSGHCAPQTPQSSALFFSIATEFLKNALQ